MKTSSRLNLPAWLIAAGLATILPAAMLMLSAQTSVAGSATWTGEGNGYWEDAMDWTQGGPPNGPADTATFPLFPNAIVVSIGVPVEVNSIVNNNNTTDIDTYGGPLTISGAGVIGKGLAIVSENGEISFRNSATVSGQPLFNVGDPLVFNDSSSAGNAEIYAIHTNTRYGETSFNNTSTAGNAHIANDPGCQTVFNNTSTAGDATITGGAIFFNDSSTGGTAQVIVNYSGSSYLDISGHQSSVTVGSIEGAGNVVLGANNLTVGTNGLSTSFSGTVSNDGQGGSLAKIGSGILTLELNDCIADNVGLILVSGSVINLNFIGDPDVIESLVVDGVPQPPGVYGSPDSGAPNPLPEFAGTGTVEVTMGPTPTATPTPTPTSTIGGGGTPTATPTATHTPSPTPTATHTPSPTPTATHTPSPTPTATHTPSPSPTATHTPSPTPTAPHTPTPTPTATQTPPATPTATPTPTAGAPIVATNPATNVASSSATLNGTVNPHGSTTSVHFQYGTTTNYSSVTANQNFSGTTTQNVSANISALSASTTYHCRIVATNSHGTRYGSDRTFITLSATGPPVVTTSSATLIASFSATLNGSVDPHGLSTTVHFEYGTTTGYGHNTASQSKTGNTYQNVRANISGLSASTTYHFRIVATNSAGTTVGGDRTFTTLSVTGTPVVITNPATLVASFSSTLNGSLNPHGLTTSVHFQYGTTTSYGLTTAPQSRTGNTYVNVSANISSLTASTMYHFRIVATNSAGTTYGSDRTFTTLTATGPPVVTTSPATNVAISSATLNGSLDPHGLTTSVNFQYGTTTSYGHTTPMQSQTGDTYRNITANISGLTTHTTYHFRIIATNTGGTMNGVDRTFTTP